MSKSQLIQSDTKDKILACENLPSLPSVAVNILEKLEGNDTTPNEITALIECEPAICTRVLSMANSPLYALSRPVTTLGHAVVLLGISTVSQLAISIATQEVFCAGSGKVLEQRTRIYEQSLVSATNARILATQLDLPSPDETFLSGVMQDIGKLVLLAELGDEYCDLLTQRPDGETTTPEKEWIGLGHDQLGEICGRKWGLPIPINRAIFEHHLPFGDITQPIAKTLTAANYYSRNWHIGFEHNEELPVSESIESQFDQSKMDEIETMCKDSYEAIKAICA